MTDFRNIWMPLAERFYRAAYYMLESQQDAEDAVQELYLKIWKSHANLTDLKSPAAYGMSLLKNICIDRIRRREIRKAEPLEAGVPQADVPPEKRLAARDILKKVMEEIDRLPQKQAWVMKMMVIEDLDYKEISERTGLSQVHVRVLISTARKTLKQKLRI
jgi:RNA polymerase sigma-70 factor (ECF subfamily)